MPSCCGGSGTCTCKVSAGVGVEVSGSGTQTDPFVISAASNLVVQDNARFNLTLVGDGTSATPYVLTVDYAATSKLDDVPDVNASTPTNGQVLSWNSATSRWVPANPTTAAAGSVQHDQSLSGDGSAGTPLAVVPYAARFIALFGANGIGISDTGINQLVRHFIDATARGTASPAPVLNTLSMLDSDPGRITYWDGAVWQPLPPTFDLDVPASGGEFLVLSGAYDSTRRLTHVIRQVTATTDASGNMDVLGPADLSTRAGVLSCSFQETGALAFKAVLYPNTDRISAHVYNLVGGAPYPTQVFTGIIDAWVY